ncbi:hypothetical protein BD410DRAFT_821293 [Rickenella mellea]|uniref:BAH-domain-containing protein n=1 Tax=Rickenella mellea TaxID=50990 RepID=A0A4Y7Q455_9AGAM|nr:hypothetical protein BD410DRAFT_821293 [Rickenella mellea]
MPIPAAQKAAIEEIMVIILTTTAPRGKRLLADMFLELVDEEAWPEYYEVIPEPRCLNKIKEMLQKNKYKDALVVFSDLSLVFLNALFYNEDGSQIAKDAATLKGILEAEWSKRTILPTLPDAPPASAPQAVTPLPSQPKPEPAKVTAPAPAPPPTIPAAQPQPQPAPRRASPLPILSSQPPLRQSSPDMDVDIGGGGSSEPEGVFEDMTRDAESDDIVKQLERSLPKWEGFGEGGWMAETSNDRYLEIVTAIKGHKDIHGNRVATVLDNLPEESTIKYISFNTPLSLKIIEGKARMKSYQSPKEFDMDFARLFEKGRRWYEMGSDQYGNILLLQRLYQAITSPTPPTGPPFFSQTNFAALRAGPGTARPLHAAPALSSPANPANPNTSNTAETDGVPGVTTFRVSSKDRQFVDDVWYRGHDVRLADWLHLANPDDPSRPIVAQVFKCWVSEEVGKKGRQGVTVCWYYRPEQTVHPAHRQFWEGEVFKTGHFADHPLEDIIEKIACQFTARHIRGRPRPPYWYPGWPLYVCDSRYNDRERVFVKIKNWNSCVPEEVRKSKDFMPIYPFEKMVFPRRFPSPFVLAPGSGSVGVGAGGDGRTRGRGSAKFPGGIGDSVERAEGEKIEGGGTGRKRPRRNAPGTPGTSTPRNGRTDEVGPSKGLYVGTAGAGYYPSSTGVGAGGTAGAQWKPTGGLAPGQVGYGQIGQGQRRTEDRSLGTVAIAGGLAAMGGGVVQEKLPAETAKHFDRDPETNEVLWFSGPPLDTARTTLPRYSLAYLHYLAMKRKRDAEGESGEDDDNEDGDAEGEGKGRGKNNVEPMKVKSVQPTAGEKLGEIWSSLS